MRRRLILLLVLSLLVAPLGAAELRFTVSYRSASTIYIAGGSADGLAVGERLSVKAKNELVGEIEIQYLSEHSASCRILRESRPIRVGDAGVITRAADHASKTAPEVSVSNTATKARPAGTPTSAPSTDAAPAAKPFARTRGSVSFGLARNWDQTERHYDFEQRFGRLDFAAWEIGGHPLQFVVRGRARQDLRPRTLGFETLLARDERRDRLYEVALRYEPGKGRAILEAGRLGVPTLSIGYLDGVSVELRALQSMRFGGFFGKRVEVDRLTGFIGGSKYGAFARVLSGGSSWPGAFDATLFGIREFAGPAVSREYVGVQSRLARRSFVFAEWAEVDLLRDWRKPADGKMAQLSNLSASATYRPSPSSSLALSYDQRRNYRSAETRSVPEILFDTYAHQGFRGSFDVSRANGPGLSLFGGVRMKDQQSDTAYSGGGGLHHASFTGAHLSVGLDGYYFTNGVTSGLQGSARVGRNRLTLTTDFAFGISSYTLKTGGTRRQNEWLRLSAYRTFGRRWWFRGEGQYDRGDDVKGPRALFEMGYRF